MNAQTRADVARALGRLEAVTPVAGGDICSAHRVLAQGEPIFVKTRADAPEGMFESEARGLALLRANTSARVPEVRAVGPRFLALEFVARGAPRPDYDAQLGHALAELHQTTSSSFGLDRPGFIGPLPQPNGAHPTFADFYWNERLIPMAERAGLPPHVRRLLDALEPHRVHLSGPPAPPSLIHGDLWGGNAMADQSGRPVLYDPSVAYSHREVDLAMMALFGGFSARVLSAYDERFARADGHASRVPFFQLYPLLVHVALFGSGYHASLIAALEACLRAARDGGC